MNFISDVFNIILSNEKLSQIVMSFHEKVIYDLNSFIIRQGQVAKYCFIIKKGDVQINSHIAVESTPLKFSTC